MTTFVSYQLSNVPKLCAAPLPLRMQTVLLFQNLIEDILTNKYIYCEHLPVMVGTSTLIDRAETHTHRYARCMDLG